MRNWKPKFAEEDQALIKLDASLPAMPSDETFLAATKTGDWLPRLLLMTANSEKVKSAAFPMNHYALINGQNMRDIGTTVDILIIAWRAKAIEMGAEVITIFDTKNPAFQRIQDRADEKDSGCMFGPEYLVYVPATKEFATFFMGSKSSRREAPGVKARMFKSGTLKSQLVKTKKYQWQVPMCVPCSTAFEMPDSDEIKVQAEKFLNPPAQVIEKVDAADKAATDRDR